VRYDPAQGFIAQGVPSDPVGTPDELDAHRLPKDVFLSCSEPSTEHGRKSNVGCPDWYDCTMSYRGLHSSEGGGPRSHCWERIKSAAQGGGIVRGAQPCYYGVSQQDICQQNGEVLRVIADEGESFEMLTTIPDITGGKDQHGYTKWDTKLVTRMVEPFKRLGQHQKLAQHELRASILEREQEKVRHERAAKNLGIVGSGTPLDKRGRGSRESKAKES